MKNRRHCITRRDFARGTLGAALSFSLLGTKSISAMVDVKRSSRVFILRDAKVMDAARNIETTILQKMINETLIKVTGEKSVKEAWQKIVNPEDTVGLVPTPHLNPTHSELTDLVKKALIEVVGVPEENIIIAQGRKGPELVKPCTALISMPGLKAHWLTGIGTVIKNYIMYSGRPRDYHHEDSARLGEIWLLPDVKDKTRLVLVDALYPLCDKGPQPDPRYKWDYKGLIAGYDPVAVDTICLKIITAKREAIKGEPWPLTPPPICLEAADTVYGMIVFELNGFG